MSAEKMSESGDSKNGDTTYFNASQDRIDMLMIEACNQIESFASGYDSSGFKATVDSFSNTIKSVQLLSGYNATTHKEEEVGRRLYEDLDRIITSFGKGYAKIIQVNFDIENFRAKCINRRTEVDIKLSEAKVASQITILEPKKDRIEFTFETELDQRIAAIHENTNISKEIAGDAITAVRVEIQKRINKEYYKQLDNYDRLIEDKNSAIANQGKYKSEFERAVMIERVCNLFMDSSLQIINKVKDVVTHHTNIQSVLKGTVIVRETREQLCNPLENNSLTGVVEILYDRYQKKTFVSFTLTLMECIGWSLSDDDSTQNPAKGVTEVQQMISRWRSRDMGKELNDDQLFTAILIKGLSPKANYLRQTLLTETHKFIMGLSDEERTATDLPIFNFVCQHVLSHQSTLQYTNRMRKPTIQFPTGNNNNSNKYGQKGQKDYLEAAASASAVSDEANAAVNDTNEKIYNGEMLRDKNIKFTHPKTQRQHPYVAAKKLTGICIKCYPETGEGIACGRDGKDKKCYALLCVKCGMYGHPQAGCMQIVKKN